MSVEKIRRKSETVYRVRWREGGLNRARTFSTHRDARDFDAELRRHRRAGSLAQLDRGTETLDEYVTAVWVPAHGTALAPNTRRSYAYAYDRHISPRLGSTPLRELTPDAIARLQADLLAGGLGYAATRKAVHVVLKGILTRAVESHRITVNPARAVRMARAPQTAEVRPLAPATVEQLRAAICARPERRPNQNRRDATIISTLAYAGLRPQELRGLRWRHVQERTLIVNAPKTGQRRSVRLLAALAGDLREWRMASPLSQPEHPVLPGDDGDEWGAHGFNHWAIRTFRDALSLAGLPQARPYDLRHSFASLLLHEGRSPIYCARQLGHGADLTLKVYGHVIQELEDAPGQSADEAISAARDASSTRLVPVAV